MPVEVEVPLSRKTDRREHLGEREADGWWQCEGGGTLVVGEDPPDRQTGSGAGQGWWQHGEKGRGEEVHEGPTRQADRQTEGIEAAAAGAAGSRPGPLGPAGSGGIVQTGAPQRQARQ